jgi:hypothetical protein
MNEIDPKMQRLKDLGPSIMVMRPTEHPWPVKRMGFLARCIDAWSPRQRKYRNQKLMKHPQPLRGILWRAWRWIRYSKAHREKPWKIEMDWSHVHSYPEGTP